MSATGRMCTKILRGLQFNLRCNTRTTACFTYGRNYHHLSLKQFYPQVNCHNFKKYLQSPERAMGALSPLDPSSFSQPDLAKIKHVSLKLNVDFSKKVLHGSATLDFEVLKTVNEILLDVKNLAIESVQLADGALLNYTVDDEVPNYGAKLNIKLPKTYKPDDLSRLLIKIDYSTAPSASALQWLEPAQTSGKVHPYLFSQCQPIHARSILPCQDTPAVKFTYDAEVTAPSEFTVLMSALRSEPEGNKTVFRQPVPIPSYLLALAVGVLENRRLGPRSLVWSEKEEVERSAWEFAETEKYLQAAEQLCGKYEWTQYDLLVLPPSFPYGGMENPCLTFVTPTLLAGDRSQADVIVHEIMHSWTGNLVTNRNFEHFWLNEGFTVFLERKVAASLIDNKRDSLRSRDFHSLLGLQELRETIVTVLGEANPLTKLVVDLNSTHPDDAFSRVPYEKGSLFLRYLENLVGGPEVFDEFLRFYLTKYRRQSLDTDQFKNTFLEFFKDNAKAQAVNWDQWLNTPGMPPIIPDYDPALTEQISHCLPIILKSEEDSIPNEVWSTVASFTPHQTINLLQGLIDSKPLSVSKLRLLAEKLKWHVSKNSEIQYRYLRLCVRSRDQAMLDSVFQFVNNQGRMKYVRPIYRDLYDWEEVRDRAIENFLKNEPNMMTVSAFTLRKDLHLRSKAEDVAI